MTDAVKQRREFIEDLRDRPLVENVDFTRDGFETVVLELGDTADGWGSPELSIEFGDERVTYFTSESGQWYRQEWTQSDRADEEWRPVGIEAIDEPDMEVHR
jgi:hypothetical protein